MDAYRFMLIKTIKEVKNELLFLSLKEGRYTESIPAEYTWMRKDI